MRVHHWASFMFQWSTRATVWNVLVVKMLVEVWTNICKVVGVHPLLALKIRSVKHLLVYRLVACSFTLRILGKLVVMVFTNYGTRSHCLRLAWVTIRGRNAVWTLAHNFHSALLVKLSLHAEQVNLEVGHFMVQIYDFRCKLSVFLSGTL